MGSKASSIPGESEVNPREVSWGDIRHNYPDGNGLVLNDIEVPEELLELIFSYLDLGSIVSVNSVCQVWKSVSCNLGLWRMLYKRRGIDWSKIPESIKRGRNAWCVSFVGLQRDGFETNMVRNGSGENDFSTKLGLSHWDVSVAENYYNSLEFIHNESPPIGCDPLPDDGPNTCFATSFQFVFLRQTIRLGLKEEMMELMAPFEVRFSILAAARHDCSGKGLFRVHFEQGENSGVQLINDVDILMDAGEVAWQKISFSAFFDGTQKYRDCRFLITFGGQDRRFWAGHYGLKFSRVCATIKLLSPEEAAVGDPEYPRTTVSSRPASLSP